MIQLGDTAKDMLTGFEGVVISRTEYLFGCRRLVLQPAKLKDGKPPETMVFDEPQLVLVRTLKLETAQAMGLQPATRTGGPRPVPAARQEPPQR